jgi:hypothetical protein
MNIHADIYAVVIGPLLTSISYINVVTAFRTGNGSQFYPIVIWQDLSAAADIQEADRFMSRGVGQYMSVQAFSTAGDVNKVDDFREFGYLRNKFHQHIGGAAEEFLVKLRFSI